MHIADVDRLAKILALELTEEEKLGLLEKFTDTVNKISILRELDTRNIKETSQVTGLVNIYQDFEYPQTSLGQTNALDNAPVKERDLFSTQGSYRNE